MRIALLLDDLIVSNWTNAIIRHIQTSKELTLAVVVVQDSASRRSKKKGLRTSLYRVFRAIDRLLFLKTPDAFQPTRIDFETTIPTLHVTPEKWGNKNIFPNPVIQAIKNYEPDLILRFGFGIISGAILTAAKHGVLSLHHDDNDVIRGGPPAFWEWYHKMPLTGVTLQKLSEDLDGGEVLSKTFTATDFTSLIRNQSRVFWTGVQLMNRTLDRLASNDATAHRNDPFPAFYSGLIHRDPGWVKSAVALYKLFGRATARTWNKLSGFDQWCIFFRLTKENISSLSLRRFQKLTPPRDRFWADPFVLSRDDKHYVFVEEFIYNRGKGHISCIVLDKSGNVVTEATPVLSTLEHLSYPFVFEYDHRCWMIPESAEHRTVDLYECMEFPLRWEFRKTLMKDVDAFDSTVHFQDGYWWLFQTQRRHEGLSANDDLYLYYTDDILKSSWQPHPGNPVITDPRSARPAGKIFFHDGHWYRPSQICTPRYGYGVKINRITILNKKEYSEETVNEVLPFWTKNLKSTHTLNFNSQITTVDGQVRRSAI